jgi:hypothetical protein
MFVVRNYRRLTALIALDECGFLFLGLAITRLPNPVYLEIYRGPINEWFPKEPVQKE